MFCIMELWIQFKLSFYYAVPLLRYSVKASCLCMFSFPMGPTNTVSAILELWYLLVSGRWKFWVQLPPQSLSERLRGLGAVSSLPTSQRLYVVLLAHFRDFLCCFVLLYPEIFSCKRKDLGGMWLLHFEKIFCFISQIKRVYIYIQYNKFFDQN